MAGINQAPIAVGCALSGLVRTDGCLGARASRGCRQVVLHAARPIASIGMERQRRLE